MPTSIRKSLFNSTNVRSIDLKQQGFRLLLGALWQCAPGYAQRLVKKLFFSPTRPPLTNPQKQLLAEGDAFELRFNDKTIRYWQWGTGPAILLIHGWNGRGVQLHRFIDPLVKSGHAVIAFDAPAHGESDGTDTSYFEFTDVIRTFLKPGNGFHITAVIGHSLGAGAIVNGLSKERASMAAVLIAPALRLKEVLYSTFDRYGIPKSLYQHMIANYERIYGYSMNRDNPVRLLPEVLSPMLIVHDLNDSMIPYMDSRSAAENNADVRLHTTAGLGHKRILLDETVLRKTLTYLAAHRFQPVRHLKRA